MRRREFIAGLGGAVAWPQWVGAQKSGRTVRLGYVWIGKKGSESSTLDGMRLGLRDLGYTEGKDYVFEDRYADSDPGRLPAIFAELVGLKVDLILSPGNVVTKIAAQATSTIPIIATAPDLLAAGFVKSLARPGGNVTGMSLTAGAALAEKWLELVTEIVPDVKRVALLMNSLSSTSVDYADRLLTAATALRLELMRFGAGDPQELDRVLDEIKTAGPGAMIVESDPNLLSIRAKILAFAAAQRLPTIYGNADYMPDGGLMAYATSIHDVWRKLATYVDKVIRGAKPGELPSEQAAIFKLVINIKVAREIGLTLPPSILIRADEVIE